MHGWLAELLSAYLLPFIEFEIPNEIK